MAVEVPSIELELGPEPEPGPGPEGPARIEKVAMAAMVAMAEWLVGVEKVVKAARRLAE